MKTVFSPTLIEWAKQATATVGADEYVPEAATQKIAFVDPAAAAGGGAGGMDPQAALMGGQPMAGPVPPMPGMAPQDMAGLMGGGAPPTDPAAMGGDPAAAAGSADPAEGGSSPEIALLMTKIDGLIAAMQGGAGGAGGAEGAAGAKGVKPKIDQNMMLLYIAKALGRISEKLGVDVSANEILPDVSGDINQQIQQLDPSAQQQAQAQAPPPSAISSIAPIQGASPDLASPQTKQAQAAIDGGNSYVPPASAIQSMTATAHRFRRSLRG